jgi:hypothetical protein
MISYFCPTGKILDPCSGNGIFLKHLIGADWCEISKGRDFYNTYEHYDWIISNPPYGSFTPWLKHSFEIADKVCYLFPLWKIYISTKRLKMIHDYGGISKVRHYGNGTDLGFPFGFAVAAILFESGYDGGCHNSWYEY